MKVFSPLNFGRASLLISLPRTGIAISENDSEHPCSFRRTTMIAKKYLIYTA